MSLTRRRLFGVGSGLGLSGLFSSRELKAEAATVLPSDQIPSAVRQSLEDISDVFAYCVASGDPLQDRVILWTHVASRGLSTVDVVWQAALDISFENVVSEGRATAEAAHDFTVKVDAILPFAGTTYFYRFCAHEVWSPIGRTRTAPATSENLRVAVVSCSSIWSGYFNAYEILSRRSDLDLIVHCGDYTYNTPDHEEERNMPFLSANKANPGSLKDHRQRYRYYRSDTHLRAAHQQHPWAIVWDNHDVVTDAPLAEAMQAFFEWTPNRAMPEKNRIYRSLDYGSLLKVILLDTRMAGRRTLVPGTNEVSILGEPQFEWLKDELKSSTAQWTIIVNQVLFSSFGAMGKTLFKDSWSGFEKDRDRVLKFLADEKIDNTIIVTGDAHISYAYDLMQEDRNVGVEFLPTSVTRGNLDEAVGEWMGSMVQSTLAKMVEYFNPNNRYFEAESHGYGIVDLKPAGANCEFWYVDHKEQTLEEHLGRALYTESGYNRFTDLDAVVTNWKTKTSAAAPSEERLYMKGYELGGQTGSSFDGLERLNRRSQLSGLRLRSGDRIDALGCSYSDGLSWMKGGTGGKEQKLDLATGEYIRSVKVGIGLESAATKLFYLKIVTSENRVLEGGTPTSDAITFTAPAGKHIVSFFGRSDKSLIKLGPIFAPDF